MKPLGFIYDFQKENKYSREALICTNSDELQQLELLAEGLPEVHFNIVARTDMSEKLLAKDKIKNITLYPRAKEELIDSLFKKCDWYFDINRGTELANAVYRAFLHNQIIMGFNETLHNMEYICKEHICNAENAQLIILAVKAICGDDKILEEEIVRQHVFAMSEDADSYLFI